MDELIQISYVYYNKALEQIKNSKVSSAKINLEQAIRIYSKDIETLNLLGVCEYLLCNFNNAFNYWSKSKSINDIENNATKYLDLLNKSDFKQIINIYNDAIEKIHKKNYNDSIILLKEIISIDQNLIEPYYLISLCYIQLNNYDKSMEYLQIASDKDSDNNKYLQVLTFIKDKKEKHRVKKYNLRFTGISVALISVFSILGIYIINDSSKSEVKYQTEINLINYKYQESLLELEEEKQINKKLIDENSLINSYQTEVNQLIFNSSINYYKNNLYNDALQGFEYLANKNEDFYLKSESTYFTAASYQRKGEYDLAVKYYEKYIEEYYNENYYDDSLYNIGLILFENDDIEESKKFLLKLKNEVPNSIYYNSYAKSILEI